MAENNLDESIARAIEFDSTYPPATAQTAGTTYGAPTSNLQQLVTRTLQGVLGRSFKPDDPESFQSALNVSFETEEVDGKNVYKHIPRAYPAIGATDIGGGISGAQYSLVTFAKALHEQTKPLIKNLHSLNASVDEEDLEATKAIFTTAWDEFVAELSREGGPRASRADTLSDSIFDTKTSSGHLVDLGNQLAVIKGVQAGTIEFDRSKVVTSEEEGYLTNFIALTDYFIAVAQAWKRYRDSFLGKDLGSGLLQLERAFAVVEDGVNEVYLAMDSVNIDQAERLIITIGFDPPDQNLTVEDLLSWISSFVSQEGPTLIRDGGRRGVKALIPTAVKLDQLTGKFIDLISPKSNSTATPPPPAQPASQPATVSEVVRADASVNGNSSTPAKLPDQFNHARVIHPLSELQRYLKELLKQAKAIAEQPAATTPPSGSSTPPSGSTTPPSGSSTPPSGSNTPPSESSTPPYGSTTPSSESSTPSKSKAK